MMPSLMQKTNKKILIAIALFLVIFLLVISYSKRGHFYNVDLFKTEQGWGYDIVKNKQVYIHQPFIPAVEGQVPFPDKSSARKTGRLVIKKLRNHKTPSITQEEIKAILKN
jgi:hypothetical protein